MDAKVFRGKAVAWRWAAFLFWLSSLLCFVGALQSPIMRSEILMGLKKRSVYFLDSVSFFYEEGEWFLAALLFTFTFVFPLLKYAVLATNLSGRLLPYQVSLQKILDFINKWAMLDVFVVALIIINLKMTDSLILVTDLGRGTSYFAASVLLLTLCAFCSKRWLAFLGKECRAKALFQDAGKPEH